MRKLVVLSFITLDGVMQAPGGPEEDPTGGFKHGGWVAGYFDDFLGKVMDGQMSGPFDLLLGRKTYEIFAAHWPYVKADEAHPIAAGINKAKKYVASRTLTRLDWSNSELIKGDVAAEVKKLREQDGPEIQVHGSGNLIQTLLKHDLVDELWLKIFPITLGRGKRLFAEGTIPVGFNCLKAGFHQAGSSLPRTSAQAKSRPDHYRLRSPPRPNSLVASGLKRRDKMSKKDIATQFLRLVAAGNIQEAYDKYIAPDFRHHNAYFKGDRESLKVAMEEAQQKNPNKELDIKMALEDGGRVAVFSHLKQNPEDRGGAVVHIFRFSGSHIVEMWDLGQQIPENMPNEHGMF